VCFVTIGFENN